MTEPTPWPDRIVDLAPAEKMRLTLVDPARYMAQCRRERHAEAVEFVSAHLVQRAAARRTDGW